VEAPRGSRRAGIKALYAALAVLALEPPKLQTAALPKALLSPAEIRILKSLGYSVSNNVKNYFNLLQTLHSELYQK